MQKYKNSPEYQNWKNKGSVIWYIGWLLFGLMFLVYITDSIYPVFFEKHGPGCPTWTYAGIYCTGCGCTRALLKLVHGQVWESIYYNCLIVYVVMYFIVYQTSGLLYVLSRGKIKYWNFQTVYVFIGLGLAVLQAVMKNILLYRYHIIWM